MGRAGGRARRVGVHAGAVAVLATVLTTLLLTAGTASAAPAGTRIEATPQALPAAVPAPRLPAGAAGQPEEGRTDLRGPLAALAAAVVLAVLVLSQASSTPPRHERP